MPVIFASSTTNQREQSYVDVLDESYEFPVAYANRVHEGDVFLYYRGTKTAEPPGDFGTGVVGGVTDSPHSGRLRCAVLNVVFFTKPVPLRDPKTAEYFEEPGPNRVNFQQGVRSVTDGVLRRILANADALASSSANTGFGVAGSPTASGKGGTTSSGYSSDVAKRAATELFAVNVVEKLLREEFPEAVVTVQPRNHPGFDILVEGAPVHFVEVKGTMGPAVEFFLTEGERKFGLTHASVYRLYGVYAIDLATGQHNVFHHDGAITGENFTLEARQYCVVLSADGMAS